MSTKKGIIKTRRVGFSRGKTEKRIVVSHARIWEQAKADEQNAARKEARAEADKTKKAVKNLQQKVEKPTLGDLGALAQIKEKLQQEEKGGAAQTPETEG